MNAGFFMVEPSREGFSQALSLVHKRLEAMEAGQNFDLHTGWGTPSLDATAPAYANGKARDKFSWNGAIGDQGLFYYWARFVRKEMTQILRDRVLRYRIGPNGTSIVVEERPTQEVFANATQRSLGIRSKVVCKFYGACGVPGPYADHAHFYGNHKPHKYPHTTPEHLEKARKMGRGMDNGESSSAIWLWWKILFRLQEQHSFDYSTGFLESPLDSTTQTLLQNSTGSNERLLGPVSYTHLTLPTKRIV